MRNISRCNFWLLLGFMLALLVVPALSFGGDTITTSTSTAAAGAVAFGGDQSQKQTANPTATITQTFEGTKIPGGAYRQDPGIIIQGNASMPAFFGPFVPGWKVLDDLTSISRLTRKEADTLGGGTKCLLKVKSLVKWEMDQVNILYQYDRKTMPEPIGWIFCTADGETTIDIIADAARLAMDVGGTDLVLLKHKVEFSTSGWGLFLTGGFTRGQMSGGEMQNATNGGGVSGIGYGKTKGISDDGLVFGIVRR